ncbi:alpha/beta hydrolase [Dactylosporangium sp. CA-233914]|uniref:alpha/beta hydrolase n=1 Tax=Dactylosporangium sp. CA-233914 TaxID=3239934 RepID=UPI003D91F6ED
MTRKDAIAALNPDFLVPGVARPLHVRGRLTLWLIRRFNKRKTSTRPGVTSERKEIPGAHGLRVVVHRPDGREAPTGALLWIFGGGLISGSAEHVNDVASTFAAELGIVVVVPDYRLAPEHPYPAAIDDNFAALTWLAENVEDLGVDADRIIVGGESAGAGLAAALAQRARDAGISLRLQVMIAPMLDDRSVIRAEENGEYYLLWTVPSNRYAWMRYLGHAPGEEEVRPYAVPARREDLRGLAPAWISVGESDHFYAEAVDYARRLSEAGVRAEICTIPGAHHGWELLTPEHPEVLRVQSERLAAMRSALWD